MLILQYISLIEHGLDTIHKLKEAGKMQVQAALGKNGQAGASLASEVIAVASSMPQTQLQIEQVVADVTETGLHLRATVFIQIEVDTTQIQAKRSGWDTGFLFLVSKTDEFCIQNEKFCIQNGDFAGRLRGRTHRPCRAAGVPMLRPQPGAGPGCA